MSTCDERYEHLGLGAVGKNCLIHETVQFFHPQHIFIGENVRIDCFSVLSAGEAGIHVGSHIHVGAGCYLFGSGGRIVLEDFSGLSPRVSLFTASDDFTEGYLRGPQIVQRCRKVQQGDITLRSNALVGAGCVVLCGVTVGTNSSVGALSLVNRDVPDHAVVRGSPAREIARRSPTLYLKLIDEFRKEYKTQ